MDPSNQLSSALTTTQPPTGGGRRLSRGPFARWPRIADTVIAMVIFVMTLFVVEGPNETFDIRSLAEVPIGAFFILGAACAAIIWRRDQPLPVLAVTLFATNLSTALGYSELIGLTLLIALYTVGRYVIDDTSSFIGVGGVLVVTLSTPLFDDVTTSETGFALAVMFAIWYIGRRMRFRGERVAQRERERVAEARRKVAEERTRIARELHDVVAHRVSLMTVQAGAAKTVAAADPESALRAMEAVELAGREALDELRHLLDVLRPEAGPDELGPQPGLADIPHLVNQFEDAGLDVSLTMNGVKTHVPARVDLFSYRIVQESLTNVLRHAGPRARAEVRVSSDRRGIVIAVVDDGHSPTTRLPGSGHGIIGMRERAVLLGGSLDAKPRPGGGFEVIAHLPIGDEPT